MTVDDNTPPSELRLAGLVSCGVAARKLGVCLRTVRRWIAAGELDGVRIRRRWYVRRESLLRALGR